MGNGKIKEKEVGRSADMLGMFVSIACMLHCVLLPVLIAASVLTQYTHNDFHFLDYIFVGLAFLAVILSSRKATIPWVKPALWGCFLVFSLSTLLHEAYAPMKVVSIIASLALVGLHWTNLKAAKSY